MLDSSTIKQYYTLVNSKQRKTLLTIFTKPTPSGIEWRAIASLIKSLGGKINQGDGSRVRIDLKGQSLNIHSPHTHKDFKRYAIRLIK